MRSANREPSLLIVAVRSAKNDWAIKDLDRVVKIDPVFDVIEFVLLLVPIESSQDQFSYLFVRHTRIPALKKLQHSLPFSRCAVGRWREKLYIQLYFAQIKSKMHLAVPWDGASPCE